MQSTLVDSYSEINQNSQFIIGSGVYEFAGQSFMARQGTAASVKFYLRYPNDPPTGNLVAKIYSHSGVYGNGIVAGSPLCVSDPVDGSLITKLFSLYSFTFSGSNRISLAEGTPYFVGLAWTWGGDFINRVYMGIKNPAGTHPGNAVYYFPGAGDWQKAVNTDVCFYFYENLRHIRGGGISR